MMFLQDTYYFRARARACAYVCVRMCVRARVWSKDHLDTVTVPETLSFSANDLSMSALLCSYDTPI